MMARELRDRARSARVTGTTGALVVAIALVMMVIAAPSHPRSHPHPQGPAAVLSARTLAHLTQPPSLSPVPHPQQRPARCVRRCGIPHLRTHLVEVKVMRSEEHTSELQ